MRNARFHARMVRVSPDTSNQPEVTEEVMGDTMTCKT
jgi:hypothetical protein